MSPCDAGGADDAVIDAVFDGLDGHADGVANGFDAGTAVGDDADSVDPQKKGAAVLFVAGFFLDGFKSGAGQPGSRHAEGCFLNFVFEPLENGGGDTFAGFEYDIADESVADDDFDRAFKEIASLDVANEMDGGVGEKFEAFFSEAIAFGVFRADGEESDAWFGVAEDFFGVDGAHQGVIEKMLGAGVEVGAGIEQDEEIGFGGHDGGDARATDSWKGAEADGGSGDHGAGMTRGDGGIGLRIADSLDGSEDGVIPFAAEGFDGGIPHLDDFLAVSNFEAGRELIFAEFF